MTPTRLRIRRLLTVVGVIAVLALGFGSIRAASAWTAASAPLPVAPVSVATLRATLDQEQARSEALASQLRELDARSRDLETALTQAHERIDADVSKAGETEDQLAVASSKLADLERAIAKAKKALAAQAAAAARQARTTSVSQSSSRDDDDDHDDDEEDEEDEEDDD